MTKTKALIILFPVFLAFTFSLAVAITHTHAVGVDIHFHLAIAESWAKGELGMFSAGPMLGNHMPYPPLLHWLLVPSIWLNVEYGFTRILQALFLPLAVASFVFLCYKLWNAETACIGGLLILGSMAYVDRVLQVIPHSVDFMLLPVALYFGVVAVNNKKFLASSILMVWNHGLVSASALGGILLEKLQKRKWKLLAVFAAGTSIIFAISFIYLAGALGTYGGIYCTNQEWLFWNQPVFFFLTYLRLLCLGFAVAVWKIIRHFRGVKLSAISKVSIATILTTAVMIPVWPDRWVQYSTVPLALLMLEEYADSKGLSRRLWQVAVVIAFVLLYMSLWSLLSKGMFQD